MFLQIRSDFPIFPSEIEVFGAFLISGDHFCFSCGGSKERQKTANSRYFGLIIGTFSLTRMICQPPGNLRESQGFSGKKQTHMREEKWKDLQEASQPKKEKQQNGTSLPLEKGNVSQFRWQFLIFFLEFGQGLQLSSSICQLINQSIYQSINQHHQMFSFVSFHVWPAIFLKVFGAPVDSARCSLTDPIGHQHVLLASRECTLCTVRMRIPTLPLITRNPKLKPAT